MAALTNLRQRIVLHPEPGSFTAEGESARWSNKDLDPVPQENKKWEWYHVGGFWIAEGFNVAQLETPSSAVALGLNPGLAMVACLIGNLLVTLPTMSSAYLGSKYGLNFPVISRASFGMRGAYVAMVGNPLFVILLWDNRTGKFFAGFLFCFANIMTNVAGNSVPFANDLMGLFPKYINIRRGQIVCAILGFAICPWLIQAKAARFLAFLNGYTVFLGPLIGLLVSDYWLVRRGKGFNVRCLYTPKNSLYWYTAGVNPRAIAALLTGITPLLPGLAHSINENLPVARGALQFYTMAWLDGLIITMVTYYLLYLAFPFNTDPDYFLNGEEDVEVADSENVSEKADEKTKGP
ncbi:hypothetical protein LTR42_005648 [Elasticomyces elasticus]|nr:hypothetical protein LTR42_005648 [Elasticomyces elasticus]